MDDSTLNLCYDGEEDYVGILDQLQTENVDHIKFTADDRENGPFQQDAANVCDILAKILAKPNLKRIQYLLNFDHDLEYCFPKNYDVKKLDLYGPDLTFWIWKQIMESTPNVEEIYINTKQDITELPMMIQSLNGFKKLKILIVHVDNCCQEEEVEILSVEVKKVLAEEAIKIMKNVLPIELKASVAEILDLDHLDDMNNGIDSPANMLILIEKEANEDPKLIMLQRSEWPPCFRMAGRRMANGLRMASESESESEGSESESESEGSESEESEEQPTLN